MKRCSSILKLAFLLIGSFCARHSYAAACSGPGTVYMTSAQSIVYVPRNFTGVVYSSPLVGPSSLAYSCSGSWTNRGASNNIGPLPAGGSLNLPISGVPSVVSWQFTHVSNTQTYLAIPTGSGGGAGGQVASGPFGVNIYISGPLTQRVTLPTGTWGYYSQGSANIFGVGLSNAITLVPVGCTTPDVKVPLGTHSPAEFKGIGTTTTNVPFNIQLNCDQGINSIRYKLMPSTSVLVSAQSVVALDNSSTATGIGVQVLNAAGTAALPLNSYLSFSGGYNKSLGGTYNIPLNARYYQTASTITPGPANTSMTLMMLYQ